MFALSLFVTHTLIRTKLLNKEKEMEEMKRTEEKIRMEMLAVIKHIAYAKHLLTNNVNANSMYVNLINRKAQLNRELETAMLSRIVRGSRLFWIV